MNWVFGSKKRLIFDMWRHNLKQRKAFMICIENVLSKSMQFKGFHYIRETTRHEAINEKKYKLINLAFLRFERRGVGEYFNRWKESNKAGVEDVEKRTKEELEEAITTFDAKIKKIKA